MKAISTRAAALLAAALLALGPLPPVQAVAAPAPQAATAESAATPEQAAETPPAPAQDWPAALPLAEGDVIPDTVTPIGTTIDLFDYWITTRDAPDNVDPPDMDQGINAGRALLFTASAPRGSGINDYTGSAAPRTGMVRATLQDGYPTLQQSGQSLNYLFNPGLANAGKIAFSRVRGLLQIDADNYYYYDCTENFAQFNENSNAFTLYDGPGVRPGGASGVMGQFFPFNDYAQVRSLYATNPAINHYFGVTMTTRFVQMPGGTVDGTPGGTPVTYEFSGDDDVWVFIDNVLVGDLGGIHDAASLSINFRTGEVQVNGAANGTLRDKFLAAGRPWPAGGSPTFADDTYHTLKFFYLERGNYDSNMKLKFNLVSIPQSDLIKVDQTGDPVQGARFDLYYDPGSGGTPEPVAAGATGADGSFVFENPDGTLLSLNDLKNRYDGAGRTGRFLLRESSVPPGYRAPGDIQLYFPDDFPNLATLLSGNPWDTGAYASPSVTVTLPDVVQDLQGQTYPADSGLYFAVVLKRQDAPGTGSSAQSTWYPVTGGPIEGWRVASGTGNEAVLAAARANPYLFVLDSSGAYKNTIDNLPGDILTYYGVLESNGKLTADNAQYTVGFYRTSAASLDAATPDSIVRLDNDHILQGQAFSGEFSVHLYVPNIRNYLFVQKLAEDGLTPLSGAEFALYQAADVHNGAVDPGAQPYDTLTTRDLSQDAGDLTTLGGAGVFPHTRDALPAGTYYLKELQAPPGYAPSPQLVEVVVDNTDVYADAGTPGDDVTLLLGVGRIVRSMLQFAVPDDINTTLTNINAALYTASAYVPGSGSSGTWTASGQAPLALTYFANNRYVEYGPTTPGDPVYFSLDAGWGRLAITQDYAAGSDQDLKTDLGSRDLTNLFARSTIVRVRNQSTRLVLQKEVTGPLAEAGRAFGFTLTLRDGQGAPLSGAYGGLTLDAEGSARTALADGGTLTLRGLPDGTVCTVTEDPAGGYETTVRVNGGEAQAGPGVTVTTAPGLTTLLFTNRSTRTPPPAATPAVPAAAAGSDAPSPSSAAAPPPAAGTPDTADRSDPALWAALAGCSLAALCLLVRRRRAP